MSTGKITTKESKASTGPGGKHDHMKTYGPEEAALVMSLVAAHAPRWTHIAKDLSDATNTVRTAASVRNYYKRFLASKAIAERDGDSKKLNRCQLCGQIKRGHICNPTSMTHQTPKAALTVCPPAKSAAAPAPPPAAAPALALSGSGERPVPPLAAAALAPSALELADTPGSSPMGSFTFSPSMFTAMLNSPSMIGGLGSLQPPSASGLALLSAAPQSTHAAFASAVNPFAFSRAPTALSQCYTAAPAEGAAAKMEEEEVTDVDSEALAAAQEAELEALPVCEVVVQ